MEQLWKAIFPRWWNNFKRLEEWKIFHSARIKSRYECKKHPFHGRWFNYKNWFHWKWNNWKQPFHRRWIIGSRLEEWKTFHLVTRSTCNLAKIQTFIRTWSWKNPLSSKKAYNRYRSQKVDGKTSIWYIFMAKKSHSSTFGKKDIVQGEGQIKLNGKSTLKVAPQKAVCVHPDWIIPSNSCKTMSDYPLKAMLRQSRPIESS